MDSFLARARGLWVVLLRKGLKNLIWTQWTKTKGSKRDPFLYLSLVCVVLFSIVSMVGPGSSSAGTSRLFVAYQGAQQQDDPFITAGAKVRESPDLSLVQQNSLIAVSPPITVTPQVLGALVGATDYEWSQKAITEYEVQPGDTISSIAQSFNVSVNTLLWANDLTSSSLLKLGQKLVISPVSGVIHHVKSGDTLSEIAATYKSTADKIIAYNDLSAEGDITAGDILIVPDGVMPAAAPKTYVSQLIPMASSYLIPPLLYPYKITQGLHWYNAIDFTYLSDSCGKPILAAAAGQVVKVKLTSSASKWAFGGAGNTIAIQHPNGVVTSYGHVQTSFVNVGDYVSQGDRIASVGGAYGMAGSGNSTGCHVHFQVMGAKNPFAK